jgi:hypothetical protein
MAGGVDTVVGTVEVALDGTTIADDRIEVGAASEESALATGAAGFAGFARLATLRVPSFGAAGAVLTGAKRGAWCSLHCSTLDSAPKFERDYILKPITLHSRSHLRIWRQRSRCRACSNI